MKKKWLIVLLLLFSSLLFLIIYHQITLIKRDTVIQTYTGTWIDTDTKRTVHISYKRPYLYFNDNKLQICNISFGDEKHIEAFDENNLLTYSFTYHRNKSPIVGRIFNESDYPGVLRPITLVK